jgi:hypothetical protein
MVELAWLWLRYQPGSGLARWFVERFGTGRGRIRKITAVASLATAANPVELRSHACPHSSDMPWTGPADEP